MERLPVTSSNIVSIGYDENISTLEIEFKSGTYQYYDVPCYIFDELMNADSKGSYLHRNIKGSFTYAQV